VHASIDKLLQPIYTMAASICICGIHVERVFIKWSKSLPAKTHYPTVIAVPLVYKLLMFGAKSWLGCCIEHALCVSFHLYRLTIACSICTTAA